MGKEFVVIVVEEMTGIIMVVVVVMAMKLMAVIVVAPMVEEVIVEMLMVSRFRWRIIQLRRNIFVVFVKCEFKSDRGQHRLLFFRGR